MEELSSGASVHPRIIATRSGLSSATLMKVVVSRTKTDWPAPLTSLCHSAAPPSTFIRCFNSDDFQ